MHLCKLFVQRYCVTFICVLEREGEKRERLFVYQGGRERECEGRDKRRSCRIFLQIVCIFVCRALLSVYRAVQASFECV